MHHCRFFRIQNFKNWAVQEVSELFIVIKEAIGEIRWCEILLTKMKWDDLKMALTICRSCLTISVGRLVNGNFLRLRSNCFCLEFIANLRHDMFPNSGLLAQCIMTCSAYAALVSECTVYTQQLNLMYCIQTSKSIVFSLFLLSLFTTVYIPYTAMWFSFSGTSAVFEFVSLVYYLINNFFVGIQQRENLSRGCNVQGIPSLAWFYFDWAR